MGLLCGTWRLVGLFEVHISTLIGVLSTLIGVISIYK